MVGHKVSNCGNPAECATAIADGKFDVVLADPSDAAKLKGTITPRIVPVVMKPSKDVMGKLTSDYVFAFDASRDALRLLPVLTKATKTVN